MGLLSSDEKITIEAYKDNKYSGSALSTYSGSFNPSELKIKYENGYIDNKSIGVGKSPTYKGPKPENLTIPLLFDNTLADGNAFMALMGTLLDTRETVVEQVEAFREKMFSVNGDTHEANFLIISWGDFLYKGQVQCLEITYSAFKSDGEPLRAKVELKIKGSLDLQMKKAAAGLNSPDLTHSVVVKEGDSLPAIAYKVYGDSAYYLDLARVNGLKSFRKLEAGTRIIAPPIDS